MPTKVRILVIEDDTPTAMMMAYALSHAGCDVWVAHTGQKGMELARENKFDLIVLTVELPDISGFEICSELKQRHLSRHTPIVLVSKQLCEQDRQRSLELGAADYIARTFDGHAFVQRLLSHVKQTEVAV